VRKLFCTLACLAVLPYAAAQTAAAPAPVAKKAMFWKVSSADNTAWLLGSIHIGSKDMYPLPKEMEDAFESSAALLVEIDIGHVDMQKMQAMIMDKGMYKGDDVIWNHVSPETRKSVEQFCAKFGVPVEGFAKMKPWMLSIVAALLPMSKMGMDPSLGIDKHFLDKAGDKRVVEIESADWQFNLVSGFSDEMQEKFLVSATEDAAAMQERLKTIQALWSSGDSEKMDTMLHETSHAPSQISKMMLEDRNPHMADVAEQFLKGKDRAFMVVGAAHMVGKDGVVSILQKRGYKVEQVALKK